MSQEEATEALPNSAVEDNPRHPEVHEPLRLRIDPVARRAEEIAEAVARELPTHGGLQRAARGVANAAREAERACRSLRVPWGLHRLPAWFLMISLLGFSIWFYSEFLHVTRLSVAVPERDALSLKRELGGTNRVAVEQRLVLGSREALSLVESDQVDLAFVQGGMSIPDELPRMELPRDEWLVWMTRGDLTPSQVRRVLTSVEGEGSHAVARLLFDSLGMADEIEFRHAWGDWSGDSEPQGELDFDAVLVVKDLGDPHVLRAITRLERAGLTWKPLTLSAAFGESDSFSADVLPTGYLRADPPSPMVEIPAIRVRTYLVARRDLRSTWMASAAHLLDDDTRSLEDAAFDLNVSNASEMLQGLEAVLSILVYIGLAFLTLMGIEVLAYRRRFNELNTLVSLISIHQSDKDVLGVHDPGTRHDHLLYLGTCSDLLGLIGVIAGYYAQENGSLLFNGLLTVVVERADALKLNIQFKILHASIELPRPPQLQTLADEGVV